MPAATGNSLVLYLENKYRELYDLLKYIDMTKIDMLEPGTRELFKYLDVDLAILTNDLSGNWILSQELIKLNAKLNEYMSLIKKYKTKILILDNDKITKSYKIIIHI